jgi:CII-binding regulator of phage lambda lysogenization HflD
MTDNFKIKISLPSGKHIRIAELKNRDYQTILKYCENSDLEGLSDFFDYLVFNENKSLDIIDKFYTLLTLRMVFIDPDISFSDKLGHTVKFNISNILEKIDHFQNDYESVIDIEGGIIELGLPNLIYFKDVNDIYISTIKSIKLNNKVLNFNNLTLEEKEEVLSCIPNSLFAHINKHISQISKQLQSFVLIEQNTQFNIEEINTNIISNEFMGFILSVFSSGLKNFFDIMYAFTTKINIDGSTFLDLTPLDSRVLINIYNKDIDDQNKALQNNTHE